MHSARRHLVGALLLAMIATLGVMLATRERATPGAAPADTGAELDPPGIDTGEQTPEATDGPGPTPAGDDSGETATSGEPNDSEDVDGGQSGDVEAHSTPVPVDGPPPLAEGTPGVTKLADLGTDARFVTSTPERVLWAVGADVYAVSRDGGAPTRIASALDDIRGLAAPSPEVLFVAAENTVYRLEPGTDAPPKPLVAPSRPLIIEPGTLFADDEHVWFVGTLDPGDEKKEMLAVWVVGASGGRMKSRAVGDKYLRPPVDVHFDGEALYLARYYANNLRRVPALEGKPRTLARDTFVGVEQIAVDDRQVYLATEHRLWRVPLPRGGDAVLMADLRVDALATDGESLYAATMDALVRLPVDAERAEHEVVAALVDRQHWGSVELFADDRGLIVRDGATLWRVELTARRSPPGP